MQEFWLQGVVKNGQVVLATPLDLPDGTVVTVMHYDPDDDPRPIGPRLKITDEEFAELTAFITKKRSYSEWPEFEAKLVRKYGDQWKPAHQRLAAG
ncbi:MAG: hypothetical protein K8U57_21030 [Planctomycetes bacterium]|nr:hypothetical protein [Planctomycetota bacterium]